ncbi:hypothetical protein GCM10011581_39690 [Saccharopolyspora subtropica]|uniref:DUF7144 domain-containing protein n=1 Tax=Saccharopolyspora thermophila TaxID=89367 RepID=A0A917K3F4_9PSEU|nr:hypothetical protein [Saccharopolyspora subtropica]GGI98561.1 hypothetical protein GCM10011581_39690 [Saccharopolyspora subtropica]
MSTPQSGPEQPRAEARATQQERAETRAPEEQRAWAMAPAPGVPGMSGWLAFAGTIIGLVGVFNLISGFTSLFRPDYYLVAEGNLLVFNYTAWAGIWLAIGALQVIVGVGCLAGQEWARVVGVVLAGVSAIGHLAFLNTFPLWSLAVIAMSVLVIYGLVVPPKGATGWQRARS